MKFINIIILMLIIMSLNGVTFVLGAELPQEPSNLLINKIDGEHKNTRLYIKNQMIEREKSFTDEFTKRADYYEQSMKDIINKFILNVSIVFGGIILFVSGINNLIKNKLEKKKYQILLQSIKEDIKLDLSKNIKDYLILPENDINEFNKLNDLDKKKETIVEVNVPIPSTQLKQKTSLLSKFNKSGVQK